MGKIVGRAALVFASVLIVSVSACGSDHATAPAPVTITSTTFAPALGINLAAMTMTASGLYYQDVTVGSGAVAQAGKQLSVHYAGWLPDGTKFESSVDRGQPFAFTLGVGAVIPGWDEGVAGVRVGGVRKLVIPSSLGYGARGSGPIPPNSVLVFSIQLLSVQ
ncbi:MAG: FKBP-type peptidyl-prolyl cis-trans isomerase [Gemmatimonadaceae bacterium]